MKVRFFREGLILFLVLLGALSLIAEHSQAAIPVSLVRLLQAHGLWNVWNQLRWQWMYSHEILHFLSGVFGSMLGCWIFFAVRKRKS
jgi:hypothetical protein